MGRNAEIGLHEDAPGAVDGCAQLLAERGSRHPCRPQDYCGGKARASRMDCAGFNLSNHGRGADFDTEMT